MTRLPHPTLEAEAEWTRTYVIDRGDGTFIARRAGPYPIPGAKRLGHGRRERWEVEAIGSSPRAARNALAALVEESR